MSIFFEKVKNSNNNIEVIKDCIIKPSMFIETDNENFISSSVRPDIVTIDRNSKEVKIIEFSSSFDGYLKRCFQNKFDK